MYPRQDRMLRLTIKENRSWWTQVGKSRRAQITILGLYFWVIRHYKQGIVSNHCHVTATVRQALSLLCHGYALWSGIQGCLGTLKSLKMDRGNSRDVLWVHNSGVCSTSKPFRLLAHFNASWSESRGLSSFPLVSQNCSQHLKATQLSWPVIFPVFKPAMMSMLPGLNGWIPLYLRSRVRLEAHLSVI